MNQDRAIYPHIKVLVVEDYDLNLEIIVEMLRILGIEPDTAVSGKEAIEKVERSSYDLILMDIKMPEMDGYEATKKIRSMPIRQPQIFALTASGVVSDMEDFVNSGMEDYLIKPIEVSDLKKIILKHFSAE